MIVPLKNVVDKHAKGVNLPDTTRICCKEVNEVRGNMKAERVRAGLTIEEVAAHIGVHPNALTRWENGRAEPLGGNLVKLAELYGCSPEYLLEQTDDKHGKAVAAQKRPA